MTRTYQRSPDLREQVLGEETMVFDEQTDQVHVLNSTSAFVWSCLEHPMDVASIDTRVRDAYDVEGKDVTAIVAKALEQLESKKLIQ